MIAVLAPNPFKGVLSAAAAADAMARGVGRARLGAELRRQPMADGGEGTMDALLTSRAGVRRQVTVAGPLGEPVRAEFGLIEDGRVGVVELAQSSGMELIARQSWDPRLTSTYGFGQLLAAVRAAGARRIIAGIGGSVTNDAGAGMAQALGFRLLDREGAELPRGGTALSALAQIDSSQVDPHWREVEIQVACDVDNPLIGPSGASFVYAPQKGADEATVELLERALVRFQELVGEEIGSLPGAGAAGGVGAGLVYFLGARLLPGAPLIADASQLDHALRGADLAITGEGCVDAQTARGKGPLEVAHRARQAGVPVLLVAGTRGPGWELVLEHGVERVVTLDADADADALAAPADRLARAVERALR